jgi:hypothetical protein
MITHTFSPYSLSENKGIRESGCMYYFATKGTVKNKGSLSNGKLFFIAPQKKF